MREIKFRCWNAYGKVMHSWGELVDGNKIHLLANQRSGYLIMQYAGFKDREGAEIYEGDIIISFECQDGFNPLVGKVSFGADGKWIIEDSDSKYIEDLCEYADEFKVIGNIYENPELLK